MTTSSIRYRIDDVGPMADVLLISVNDSGTAVSQNRPAGDSTPLRVFALNGGVRTSLEFGGGDAYASSINEKGWIVGFAQGTGLVVYRDGKAESFPELLGPQSKGLDINSSGYVAGAEADGPGLPSEAILFRDGGITRLGTLGGPGSYAFALNEQAQVVGVADTKDTWGGRPVAHAFLYEIGVLKDLGTLGGVSSEAHDINDAGHIVGEAKVPGVHVAGEEDPIEYTHAFVYAVPNFLISALAPIDSTNSTIRSAYIRGMSNSA